MLVKMNWNSKIL